jgi:hypothetical protein
MRAASCMSAVLLALVWLAAPAAAAPPANDARTSPQPLTLPALVRGTTVDATTDTDEPPSCAGIKNSVWYSFTATSSRELIVALDATGDLDAVVDVFTRRRSQISQVSCEQTNRNGTATLDVDEQAGTDYLIRVAALSNSVADRFTLRVAVPEAPATPPGTPLPASGVVDQVDRLSDPDNAYATRLHEGVTYRINLVTTGAPCTRVDLFAPGEYGQRAEATINCDDETVYTPPRSGVYSVRVQAPRASRTPRTYRLRVGRAGPDDSAPGLELADDHHVRGTLRGESLDALDLYRFTLVRRSDLTLRLRTSRDFDLRLLDSRGGRLGCDCGRPGGKELTRRLRPGSYFIAIQARDGAHGAYVISRLASVITRAEMLADGRRSETVAPGHTVTLQLRVTPTVNGRATLVIERHDPLAGWLFYARKRPRVQGDAATVAFRPPSVGRWRVTGDYDGTRTSSASGGGTAGFRVQEPLSAQ